MKYEFFEVSKTAVISKCIKTNNKKLSFELFLFIIKTLLYLNTIGLDSFGGRGSFRFKKLKVAIQMAKNYLVLLKINEYVIY